MPVLIALALLIVFSACISTGPATGQVRLRTQDDWRHKFRTYVTATEYLDALGFLIRDVERQLAPDCRVDLSGARRAGLWIRKPLAFAPAQHHPTAGQWQDRIAITRCGRQVLHNLLVTALPDSSPAFKILLPGNSKADAKLQLDARAAVLAVAGAAHRGAPCKAQTLKIINTRFVSYLGGTGDQDVSSRIWREIWVSDTCRGPVPVEVKFVPENGGGYTFVVDLASGLGSGVACLFGIGGNRWRKLQLQDFCMKPTPLHRC